MVIISFKSRFIFFSSYILYKINTTNTVNVQEVRRISQTKYAVMWNTSWVGTTIPQNGLLYRIYMIWKRKNLQNVLFATTQHLFFNPNINWILCSWFPQTARFRYRRNWHLQLLQYNASCDVLLPIKLFQVLMFAFDSV